MTGKTSSLLALLQIVDSSFPIGTFAHSYGLEQLVRDRFVQDAHSLRRFVGSSLRLQLGGSDVRALATASEAAEANDLAGLVAIDRRLHITRPAQELRDASTAAGKRLLEEVAAHPAGASPPVPAYLEAVEACEAPGTHPVALAAAGAALEVDRSSLVAGLLFSTANALVQASMRLLPLSHRDAQAVLHDARAEISAIVEETDGSDDRPFTSFHPLQEIASMRHADAPVRFFAS